MLSDLHVELNQFRERSMDEQLAAIKDYFTNLDRGGPWYLVMFPKIFLFITIFCIPFIFAIWISMHVWNPIQPDTPFVGAEHYLALFYDQSFRIAAYNTVLYSLGLVFISVPISLFVAILLNMEIRGAKYYSIAIFVPVVTSWVVVSLIWTWIYNPQYGILNPILGMLGLPEPGWYQSSDTSMLAVTILGIWKTVGFNMVIFLAGLQGISDHFYEAAEIAGANAWQQFRRITWPLLKPTTFFVVLVTMVVSFRVFTPVFVMTGGGPGRSSYTIVHYFYLTGFEHFEMGYASAMAVVLLVVVFFFSLLQQRYFSEDVSY